MTSICSECHTTTAKFHNFDCGHTMHLCDGCEHKSELFDCYSCRNTYISDVFPTSKALDIMTEDLYRAAEAGEAEFK
jgi:hypothetical protein